jgi:hypothetical protein
MITGTGAPFPPTGYSSYQEPEEEPEPVRYVLSDAMLLYWLHITIQSSLAFYTLTLEPM